MKTLIGIVLVIVLIFVVLGNGWHINTGSGEHTGYVTAVERSGLIWKTGTVYIKTDLSSSQEDVYCVIDQNVYSKLEELARTKSSITVRFNDYLIKGFTNCNGEPSVITSVK
jgi:hypothetical protein